MHGETVKFIIT